MPPSDRRGEIQQLEGQLHQWKGWISERTYEEWDDFVKKPFHISHSSWPLDLLGQREDTEDETPSDTTTRPQMHPERQISQVSYLLGGNTYIYTTPM